MEIGWWDLRVVFLWWCHKWTYLWHWWLLELLVELVMPYWTICRASWWWWWWWVLLFALLGTGCSGLLTISVGVDIFMVDALCCECCWGELL